MHISSVSQPWNRILTGQKGGAGRKISHTRSGLSRSFPDRQVLHDSFRPQASSGAQSGEGAVLGSRLEAAQQLLPGPVEKKKKSPLFWNQAPQALRSQYSTCSTQFWVQGSDKGCHRMRQTVLSVRSHSAHGMQLTLAAALAFAHWGIRRLPAGQNSSVRPQALVTRGL